jgi:RHS repeat-associated protein
MGTRRISRRTHGARWVAGVLSGALLATAMATSPATGQDAGDDAGEDLPQDLPEDVMDQVETLDDGQDIESPPWEGSSSAPIASPAEVEDFESAEPTFPTPGTVDQSLAAAAVEGLEATSNRPVVLRPGGGGSSADAGPTARSGAAAGAPGGGRGASPVRDVEVTMLDRAAAERAGVTGFVFTVGAKGGSSLGEVARGGRQVPVEMEIDYSGFASAYGAGFADRLRVVALPACAVQEPVPAGCNVHGQQLETRNLFDDDKLLVEVPDLADLAVDSAVPLGVDALSASDGLAPPLDPEAVANVRGQQAEAAEADIAAEVAQGDPETSPLPEELAPFESSSDESTVLEESPDAEPAPAALTPSAEARAAAGETNAVVLAVTSGVAGDEGNFGASPLPPSGQWSVSPGSGELSWSYPIDVPAPPGGSAPTVGLGYSSGSVDGLTNATNTQASQNGLGFGDFANAYIDRSYEPCVNAGVWGSTDLCWKGHVATISLSGVSGPLIPLDADNRVFRVQDDPGWKIERIGDPTGGVPVAGQAAPEYWKVTGPDGTQYFFGLNYNPDSRLQTNSFWWVPVTSDHVGEPCRGNIDPALPGVCDMAWRWNLDRVVDPHGNVTTYTYFRQGERYDGWNGLFNRMLYIRGGLLTEIGYGARPGAPGTPAARVTFKRQNRCIFAAEACPAATFDNAGGFPDVPVDLICGTRANCPATAPSFFSTHRYSQVVTSVRDSTVETGWRDVAAHNLIAGFKGEHDTTDCHLEANNCKLYLSQIQHAGLAGGLAAYPTTNFGYQNGFLANRVDTQNGPAMRHHRLTRIRNPLGALTTVTYGRTEPCASTYSPERWDQNVLDCFPQRSVDNGFSRTGVFNKWSVTQVTDDPRHGSPALTTSYTYEGDPAWAFDWGSFSRNDDRWGWSTWRGYESTKITQGTSVTRVRSFRGMHGDPVLAFCDGVNLTIGCQTRSEQVTTIDGTVSVDDDRILVGRTLEEVSYGMVGGVADQIVESTRYTYEIRETADPVDPDRLPPRWAEVSSTTERVATAPGQFRERGSRQTYNANRQPELTEELGWLDAPGDERCSATTYADNPSRGMFVYPSVNWVLAGTCAAPQGTLSLQQTYYDGSATAAPPTRGDVTKQRTMLDNAGTWAETTATFDVLGRPLTATGPNGDTTTTVYVPAASATPELPREVRTENALGHESTVQLMVEFGAPLRETDPNGNVTSYAYDQFGRTLRVRQPTEQPFVSGDEPSWAFSYHLSLDYSAPPIVRSQRLTSSAKQGAGVVLEDMWTIYDGHGRERQTHTPSPAAGKVIVAETRYDNRGLLFEDIVAEAVTLPANGAPGTGILAPSTWANRTRYEYDQLGRTVREQWMRGNSVVHTTTHAYGPDTVTVTGPEGNQVREKVDGLGRTVEVAEHDGTGWVASAYGYDLAGNLTSVTDPEGHVLRYTYDLAGRRTGQTDPNRGSASYTYDLAGNRVTATGANGDVIHTSYDLLGRPTARRSGGPTGPVLASWEYDAPDELGLLGQSVRHDATGQWVTDVTGYDARGRATGTKLTVPAGIPGLSGAYTVSQTYDRADRVVTQQTPAVGGLPAETFTTSYSALGHPQTMQSASEAYVRSTGHDDRGRRSATVYGPSHPSGPLNIWMIETLSYNADQQLSGSVLYNSSTSPDWSTPAVRHELSYSRAGLVTSRTSELDGLGSWRECYGFDARMRLTGARTVAVASTCAAGTPTGGSQPYAHAYAYSSGNRLVTSTEDGATTQHAYPPAGQPRPYAPIQVGDVAFEWDANGNLTERTEDGATEVFAWDAEQRLDSVSGPDGDSTFVYDAEGQRLLRRTAEGSTLYFAGHEVTASANGSTVTAVRSISYAGKLIATRTPSGVEYLTTDERGSVEAAAPSLGVPSYERAYEPYGSERVADGDDPTTDRGFLGQVEDDSTGLSYLNARYYDTDVSTFLSPDPVYDPTSIKSLNPYTYGLGSPTSFADASGLSPSYTFGLEMQNWQLRWQNKALVGHIGFLTGQLSKMQDIIRQQQNAINELLTHVAALEAVIRQQAAIIDQLNARVAYLTQQVNYWRGQAYYWRGQAMYWKGQAIYWQGQAMYWKGRALTAEAKVRDLSVVVLNQAVQINGYKAQILGMSVSNALSQSQVGRLEEELRTVTYQRNVYYEDARQRYEGELADATIGWFTGPIPGVGNVVGPYQDLRSLKTNVPPPSLAYLDPDRAVYTGDIPDGADVVTGTYAADTLDDPPWCSPFDRNHGYC